MAWQQQWSRHPAVRTGDQLSLGERAADRMRNGMGSCCVLETGPGQRVRVPPG